MFDLDSKPEGLGENVIGCVYVASQAVFRLRPTGLAGGSNLWVSGKMGFPGAIGAKLQLNDVSDMIKQHFWF